jgi:hypothetical protein
VQVTGTIAANIHSTCSRAEQAYCHAIHLQCLYGDCLHVLRVTVLHCRCTALEQTQSRSLQQVKGPVHAGGIQAYGVDPSFNAHSRLYRPDSYQRSWHFFNSSDSSPELSTTRAPFAFFPRSARGYNDGFPVFFPVILQPPSTHSRASCLMVFLPPQGIYGTVCAGERVRCNSEEDAAVHEGRSLPGRPQ